MLQHQSSFAAKKRVALKSHHCSVPTCPNSPLFPDAPSHAILLPTLPSPYSHSPPVLAFSLLPFFSTLRHDLFLDFFSFCAFPHCSPPPTSVSGLQARDTMEKTSNRTERKEHDRTLQPGLDGTEAVKKDANCKLGSEE